MLSIKGVERYRKQKSMKSSHAVVMTSLKPGSSRLDEWLHMMDFNTIWLTASQCMDLFHSGKFYHIFSRKIPLQQLLFLISDSPFPEISGR